MRRVRIAQIGVGHDHASLVFDSLRRQEELFEIKGFCRLDGEEDMWELKRDSYAGFRELSPEEILSDSALDAVVVETQERQLTRYARMAVERGLHVHMDKPGGLDEQDFEQLVDSARRAGRILHLGYMYRYNPAVIQAVEAVERGTLGEIYSVEAHMDCLHSPGKRQWLERFPGGMMFFLGCHLIDLVVRIQGAPEEIIPLNACTGLSGVTSTDYGMAAFRYKNGVSFVKACAAEPGGFLRRQLVICGEKGTWEINPLEQYITPAEDDRDMIAGIRTTSRKDAERQGWNYRGDYCETEPVNRYDPMMAAFAAMARGEKKNPYSYEYEVQLHKILLEACGETKRNF